ncbi:unnamed protein product [Heligmosomoides polygyrus]|uniref:GTP_EFTU_D3 domain-containing protein n=1 Tax=Heligmosomoides polygyrus TaxID=6339 RepID=A0A183FQ38_HELPZ|nr:unnamed protein product [Heligmosomoides polygyrus]
MMVMLVVNAKYDDDNDDTTTRTFDVCRSVGRRPVFLASNKHQLLVRGPVRVHDGRRLAAIPVPAYISAAAAAGCGCCLRF